MLPTDPHTGFSSSRAPQTQGPRGALAKVTLSETSVTHGCCLWQPVPMMGMCFNCCQARKEIVGCAPANPGHCMGPGSPAARHRAASLQEHPACCPVLAILSHQPVSKSQSFQKSGLFLKKGNTKFLLPRKQSPLPPPPWNGSVPPCHHLQGKPGPSVLYSQETLKSAVNLHANLF